MVELCIKNAMKFLKIGELKKFCQKLQCKKVAKSYKYHCKSCNNVAKIRNITAKVTIMLQDVAKHCKMNWVAETSKKRKFHELQKLPKEKANFK